MTKLAAIEGQLVSIKNVSTHKSACLTIHVPEEYALKVIEAFGWPTMAAPVPVAIARLDPNAKPERKGGKLAQRAGILCSEGAFWRFLNEEKDRDVDDERGAAIVVRGICEVFSRADLDHNPEAASKFHNLELEFSAWKLTA